MNLDVNKVITFNYVLKDNEGNIIQSTQNKEPFSFLSGKNQILPKLEEEIDRMIIGSKKNIKIPSGEAYGEYDSNALKQVKKKDFPKDMEVGVGMQMMMYSPEGKEVPFLVKEIEDEDITIDFNHPLAGKDLEFEVELLDIRNATPDELNHGHAHGTEGHHH